ncbi:MAG TPA: alanine--tRNA ligase-related protein [Kofleriaceae bacterium]|nr:alanine--tRNA ligase-related protein [Kofleriaceae bacterium]
MTKRLYHDDAYARAFDATVVAVTTFKDHPAIVLDATAFYPEAGGQLGDRGKLGTASVLDTQETDDGTIVHIVDVSLEVGARVHGELDWARRRQHMAQHTAQHLLSGTLLDRAQAPTASARLGETALTIDVTRDRIPDAELAAAEDLANDLVDDDLAIRAWFPDAAELASLKLRRDPKVAADIRVVAIGDFDFSPCGGTHAARTSQLGTIRITSTERYKGMTRVTFAAARRARAELFTRDQVLRGLATRFSCAPADVPASIDKVVRDAESHASELTLLRTRLAASIAHGFTDSGGTGPVIAALPGDGALVREVASKVVAAGRDALLAAPDDAGTTVVLFRAPGSSLDCGALWKQLAAKFGGRGGGKPDQAQGRLAANVADWPSVVAELIT